MALTKREHKYRLKLIAEKHIGKMEQQQMDAVASPDYYYYSLMCHRATVSMVKAAFGISVNLNEAVTMMKNLATHVVKLSLGEVEYEHEIQ